MSNYETTNPSTDAKHANLLKNEPFMIAAAQYKRRTSGAIPKHGLPQASMAAELYISLARNVSILAEDLETLSPRQLYEQILTATENVLKETFRRMDKKMTKTENWSGYIQGVAIRAARAALYQPSRKRQTMTALLNMITKILIINPLPVRLCQTKDQPRR